MKFLRFLCLGLLFSSVMILNQSCFEECEEGYTGDNCDIEERTQFISSYNCVETCNGSENNFEVIITNGPSITQINFLFPGGFLVGTVDEDEVYFEEQVVGGGNFSGSGSITGDVLTMNWTIVLLSTQETQNCSYVCTKK